MGVYYEPNFMHGNHYGVKLFVNPKYANTLQTALKMHIAHELEHVGQAINVNRAIHSGRTEPFNLIALKDYRPTAEQDWAFQRKKYTEDYIRIEVQKEFFADYKRALKYQHQGSGDWLDDYGYKFTFGGQFKGPISEKQIQKIIAKFTIDHPEDVKYWTKFAENTYDKTFRKLK